MSAGDVLGILIVILIIGAVLGAFVLALKYGWLLFLFLWRLA